MSAARQLGKRAAPVEKRYFVANTRSPASARIGTAPLWSLAWSSITVNGLFSTWRATAETAPRRLPRLASLDHRAVRGVRCA
jgi:hypothetical protein